MLETHSCSSRKVPEDGGEDLGQVGGFSFGQGRENGSVEKTKRAPIRRCSGEESVTQPQDCWSTEHRTDGGGWF